MIAVLTWILIIGGASFLIWYGYGLLVRRPDMAEDGSKIVPVVDCHLCRKKFPVTQTISRDKIAGFVNYFCGDCIEKLYADYTEKFRNRNGT